jgi:hypothetical protein
MLFDIVYMESVGDWIEEPLDSPKWGWDNSGSAILITTKKVYRHRKYVEKTETKAFNTLIDAKEYAKKHQKLVSVKENTSNSIGNMFPGLLSLKEKFNS